MKIFIIGAGLWSSVMAERITSIYKIPVTILERRSRVGGNCHSSVDPETNIETHSYGTHIFHTSIRSVWDYITQFTSFTQYRHRVLTFHNDDVYTMPINLNTINQFYNTKFTPVESQNFLRSEIQRDAFLNPNNLEEKAISLIGRPLYEAFIRGYTSKQWEHDPRDLPPDIITRLPVRTNYNTDYFNDYWQGVPTDGYFFIFRKLLDNQLISVQCDCDFETVRKQLPEDALVIYTGSLDQYFGYKHGELEWRSLRFE